MQAPTKCDPAVKAAPETSALRGKAEPTVLVFIIQLFGPSKFIAVWT